ncbi:MAG: hypothetical protein ACI9S8_002254 [Chlamydiales bacterium]|jgi:hypothetical protein
MNRKNLLRKVAYLEFATDQLITELKYVDKLLRIVGFPNGLETVKSAAQEVMKKEQEEEEEKKEEEDWLQ